MNYPIANNRLAKALENVDDLTPTLINRGGCGIFARMLYKKLIEIGVPEEDIKIIALFSSDTDTNDSIVDFVNNGGNVPIPIYLDHIVIKYNRHYWDSTGIVDDYYDPGYHLRLKLSPTRLDQLIDADIWRSTFKRSYIPLIQQLLDDEIATIVRAPLHNTAIING